jgi:energy-coupling factor transporter transmembrane protein EcfT
MIIFMIYVRTPFVAILAKLLMVLLWVFILNFLCSKGYTLASWLLLILPYVFMLGYFAFSMPKYVPPPSKMHDERQREMEYQQQQNLEPQYHPM